MFTNDIQNCLLDELDKLEKKHQNMFLNAIEMGTLQETKHKKNKKEGHELFPKKDQINQ